MRESGVNGGHGMTSFPYAYGDGDAGDAPELPILALV